MFESVYKVISIFFAIHRKGRLRRKELYLSSVRSWVIVENGSFESNQTTGSLTPILHLTDVPLWCCVVQVKGRY